MQLPHFTRELAAKAEAEKIDNIFDLADMEVRPAGSSLCLFGAAFPNAG